MGDTYSWFQSKEDGTWKLMGKIGGENNGSKDLNLKQQAQDVIGDTKSDYDAYQDGIVKTFNESVDNMWKGGDKSDYRLVRSDNEEIKTRSYVEENINLSDPGGKLKGPTDCDAGYHWDETTKTCIVDPPTAFDWTPYTPWIYACVGIVIAAAIIYITFFGKSPLINQVQKVV